MSGVDFHPVAKDTAKSMMKVVDYILGLPISKKDKITRLAKTFNLIGSDFYIQMFNASSELFDSTAIGTTDYNKMTEQVNRLSCKLVQNYNLKRGTRQLVQDFYDSALGKAQSEAFKNAISLDRHPTLTRTMVGETCEWCQSLAGTHINPTEDMFRRHRKCDCIFTTSGYKSRNGVLTNYNKADIRYNQKVKDRLEPTVNRLKNSGDETNIAFAKTLQGYEEVKLTNVNNNAASAMKIKRNSSLYITNSYARHMDNSGHFVGTGFGSRGHNDKRPLTLDEISSIPQIVKTANVDNIVKGNIVRNAQRYKILSEIAGRKQIVIVELVEKNRINIVSSYILSDSRYREYMREVLSARR